MPYRRRYRRSYRREQKSMLWMPCPLDTVLNPTSANPPQPQNLSAGVVYKICDVDLAFNTDQESVIERIRGNIFWQASAPSGTSIDATIFGVILPDIVAGNIPEGAAIPNFPHPYDREGTDDFPLVLEACAPVGGGITSSTPIPVDVKAKRKLGKDELFTLAILIGDIFTSGTTATYKGIVRGGLRFLQKIL